MKSMAYENVLRKAGLLLLLMIVTLLATAQQHKTDSKPSAPAQHSSPPAKPSAPPQHAGAPAQPQHSTTPAGQHNTMAPGGHATNAPGGHTTTPSGHTTTPNNTGMGHNTTAAGGHTTAPGGHTTAPAGSHATMTPNKTTPTGMRQTSLKSGGTANIRKDGSVRSINKNGMQIQHGLHGGRTVVSTHNGARIVTTGRRGGYVQRAYFARGGRTYVSRTYVVNNVSYVNVYRSYGYGGYCCYYGYAPAYYWHPAYYGWAYNPWPAPVYYGWGWGGAPWYGYYGPYWAPYPAYPAAYFWVTDWMIAASLQAAYAASVEANAQLSPLAPDLPLIASLGPIPAADNAKVVMTKEVKDLLAEEVKSQLAADQADAGKGKSSTGDQAAGNQPPPALDPKWKTFVVNDELSVVADGDECSLTTGDVISRVSDTPDADKNVDVKVLASKKTDCAVGKQVSVSLEDLQEMHNHFREQISGGMEELSKKQGTGGLPKAPDTGKQDGEVPAPAADSNAAKTLNDQQSTADQTESEVKQEAASSGGGVQ